MMMRQKLCIQSIRISLVAITSVLVPVNVLLALEPPSISMENDGFELKWLADPDVVIQRSTSAQSDDWTTLLETRGQGRYVSQRERRSVFFRLARFTKLAPETTIDGLRAYIQTLALNQLRRAIDPTFTYTGLLPPDNGDQALTSLDESSVRAWVSQPGMIRIYEPGKSSHVRAYKLYSSADGVVSSEESVFADSDALASWREATARYVDLNAAIPKNGTRRYPILDPRAEVEGFRYGEGEDLPMPVEWLYLLRDGTMGTVDNIGTWQGRSEPSVANPIVARAAFWMDDETSKLNVNTASEGVPWDVPRCDTPRERNYALNQPVRGEIQRHAGHPATTSLSSVLFPGRAAAHPDERRQLGDEELSHLYDLTPSVRHSGSLGGTRRTSDAVILDDDPLHESIGRWESRAIAIGQEASLPLGYLNGFLTLSNPSPETTALGYPRMSLWPISENVVSKEAATDDDRRSAFLSNLGSRQYAYVRSDSMSQDVEFYKGAGLGNAALYRMIMDQCYEVAPGYGKSLAAKYGARLERENYADDADYDKDHYQIALMAFQHIRQTNMNDPGVNNAYSSDYQKGFGQVTGLSLTDRNLKNGQGKPEHWHSLTLEPKAPGRMFTLSEVTLVAFVTGQVRLASWSETNPKFVGASGADYRIVEGVLRNQHPAYERWMGRKFGPEDEGKLFNYVEVGLLFEIFAPCQGFPIIHPHQSIRLMTGGDHYQHGLEERAGLSMNGIPLELWGRPAFEEHSTQWGPMQGTARLSGDGSVDFRGNVPRGWKPIGGHGGPRLMSFGNFMITQDDPGFPSSPSLLPNGAGPLNGIYCQTLVVLSDEDELVLRQNAPLQVLVYTQGMDTATTENVVQVFQLRLAPQGQDVRLPMPALNSSDYQAWSRRFNRTRHGGDTPFLDRRTQESAMGLIPSHGDNRHIAAKRNVPSELMRRHPNIEQGIPGHSLYYTTANGARIEPGAAYAKDLSGRSLVKGVEYPDEVLPDFTFDPSDRKNFSPLLGPNYTLPIDPSITRDFCNGLGKEPDGAYLNGPGDGAGEVFMFEEGEDQTPYFAIGKVHRAVSYASLPHGVFFPRRMAPSPVALGSIPTAIQANAPWTCLLFRPNVSSFPHLGERGNGMIWEHNRMTMDGFQVPQMASVIGDSALPPDHLWLDYFWMPTTEPTHVASPFATEGKVNLNYQMMPFRDIHRATAIHAALKGERILAIPTSAGPTYKTSQDNPDWRRVIDAEETLKQYDAKFDRGELFLTESEICETFLIPEGETLEGIRAFWDQHRLTGDNALERPYAGLYSRVTTRSNAYRLHLRVELLDKAADTPPNQWEPARDRVRESAQSAAIIKRQLNIAHPDLPDYAAASDRVLPIDRFYDFNIFEVLED